MLLRSRALLRQFSERRLGAAVVRNRAANGAEDKIWSVLSARLARLN